jgi:2,4-dichlorophenol 6-monooxygenase
MPETHHVPVLIVGGGAAGLSASMYFSKLGVESLLVSALPTTSILPKAHELNQRAMEILNDLGIADDIAKVSTPPDQMGHTAYYAGFAGHPLAGTKIWKMECWGVGGDDPVWTMASPQLARNLPQLRLEPIMKARADELANSPLRFGHQLLTLEQDDEGATATIEVVETGEQYTVRAQYVLAADGGRTVNRLVGIEMEGARDLAQEVSVHLSADFSSFCGDDDVLIRWIFLPHDPSALCVLVPMGPDNWGSKSEEWVYHANYEMGDQRAFDDEAVVEDMRARLAIGNHPVQVHIVSRWTLGGVVADKYQIGRVFAVGDAAHRHPPTGGLGLNSALHDVQNLCWKIAYVLRGLATPALLETYGPERRPVDARNVERAVENSFQYVVSVAELGLGSTEGTPEERWAQFLPYISDAPEHAEQRRKAVTLMQAHAMEFHEHDVEYGFEYDTSAVVSDGSASASLGDYKIFTPEARPGHPLPHAWLDDVDASRRSTLDLVPVDSFLLIAGEDGQAWVDAAHELQAAGFAISAVRVGHLSGNLFDVRLRWQVVRGHGPSGAVLVRPDRCVAFRAHAMVDDPRSTLSAVLESTLGVTPA